MRRAAIIGKGGLPADSLEVVVEEFTTECLW
jgi:hypothetical protein